MFNLPNIFYTAFPAVTAALASAILFYRIKKNNILPIKDFLWHYAFAFGIITVSSILLCLINLGVVITADTLLVLYGFTVFTVILSYLLFFRGTILLFTREKSATTGLLIIFLPIAFVLSLIVLSYLNFSSIIIYTAIAWGFLFVNNNLLGYILLCSFVTGSPIKGLEKKPCALFLSLAWFFILALDIILWLNATSYHPELWILKIASMNWWFFARGIAYLLVLIAALFIPKCFRFPKIPNS